MTLRIKNWHKFQHFKDRKPPWIKLYRDLLDDIEWHELDPVAAKILTMLWLLASENEGALPSSKELSFRLRMAESQIKSTISKLSHWLEQDDIGMISEQYQPDSLETEAETQGYQEKTNGHKNKEDDEFQLFYSAYPNKKSKKAAFKAYKAARHDVSHETIMAGLTSALQSDSRFRDPKFTPYPASWLNAGCWSDESVIKPSAVLDMRRLGII